jgi:hypothetical protein
MAKDGHAALIIWVCVAIVVIFLIGIFIYTNRNKNKAKIQETVKNDGDIYREDVLYSIGSDEDTDLYIPRAQDGLPKNNIVNILDRFQAHINTLLVKSEDEKYVRRRITIDRKYFIVIGQETMWGKKEDILGCNISMTNLDTANIDRFLNGFIDNNIYIFCKEKPTRFFKPISRDDFQLKVYDGDKELILGDISFKIDGLGHKFKTLGEALSQYQNIKRALSNMYNLYIEKLREDSEYKAQLPSKTSLYLSNMASDGKITTQFYQSYTNQYRCCNLEISFLIEKSTQVSELKSEDVIDSVYGIYIIENEKIKNPNTLGEAMGLARDACEIFYKDFV